MILPASQTILAAPAAEAYLVIVIVQRMTNHHQRLAVLIEKQQ